LNQSVWKCKFQGNLVQIVYKLIDYLNNISRRFGSNRLKFYERLNQTVHIKFCMDGSKKTVNNSTFFFFLVVSSFSSFKLYIWGCGSRIPISSCRRNIFVSFVIISNISAFSTRISSHNFVYLYYFEL
jgi:hypothetical protein